MTGLVFVDVFDRLHRASEMTQQIKAPASKPDSSSLIPADSRVIL